MEPPRKVGKYRIDEKLGQGAMGEVFRGYDPVLERPVAIKIIAGRLSQDEKIRNRFLREAKAAVGGPKPLVYSRMSEKPNNQLFFWPEYRYRGRRTGENPIFFGFRQDFLTQLLTRNPDAPELA